MRDELADAVQGSGVESLGAMRLGLKSDANVFDRAGDGAVGDAGEGSGEVVLRIGRRRGGGWGGGAVGSFEAAACPVKGAELDRNLIAGSELGTI